MASEELEKQIETERLEIENAPKVPVKTGIIGRCHWCGRISGNLVYVETVHNVQRFKGVDCCGLRHVC